MTEETIPTRPLEPGDPIHMDVEEHPTVLAGDPGDLILIGVPRGKGHLVAEWFQRQCFNTPESQLTRREQDHLALLKEAA